MKVEVYPSRVKGQILPPTSKSIIHRSIICASLAKGKSVINNVDFNEDINATLSAFESLGVQITKNTNTIEIYSNGIDSFSEDRVFNCNESGSTIRFLIPVLSSKYKALFLGKSGLLNRPFEVYENIFKSQELSFIKRADRIETLGALKPDNYIVPGNVSSQFISGLLFILPLLNGDSTIKIEGNFESNEYVDITVDIMNKFGVKIDKMENFYSIQGNQKYTSQIINAEVDYSQAAFFSVLGMINNDLKIYNLNPNSLQPDRRIIEIIKKMGGIIEYDLPAITFKKSETQGIDIDVSQCPDIAPILGLLAACSNGETNILNAKRLVMKESNRLLATYNILTGLGVKVYLGEDNLRVFGTQKLIGNTFDSYNDHRIAMTLAIAGTICDSKITIENAEAINKSYPNFYKDLESLGVKVEYL